MNQVHFNLDFSTVCGTTQILRVNIKYPIRKMNCSNAQVFMIYILLSALRPKCRGYYVQLFPHYHSNFEVCNSKDTTYNQYYVITYNVSTHLLSISHFKNIAGIEKISNDTKAIIIPFNLLTQSSLGVKIFKECNKNANEYQK